MATTIDSNSINFPNGAELTRGAEIRALRWTHTANLGTAITMNNQNEFLMPGMEVTMPPAVDSDSVYLLLGHCVFDDTNSNTNGIGLCFWVQQDGNSEWCLRQGDHSSYDSIGGDRYRHVVAEELDLCNNVTGGGGNFGNSMTVSAGKVRKYRLYAQAHNSNMIGMCGVGGQQESRAQLIVMELNGKMIASGYGR